MKWLLTFGVEDVGEDAGHGLQVPHIITAREERARRVAQARAPQLTPALFIAIIPGQRTRSGVSVSEPKNVF